MSEISINVNNLSKRYRLSGRRPFYGTLRDTIADAATNSARALFSGRRADNHRPIQDEYIWSLKDLCFDVKQGEVVGLIGRNGAGKSTLLKILSRVTEPTRGYAEIHGRVASLLEVGSGFHEELTGRENVYLNGAILGMRTLDVTRKFDAIIDFAGIDKFVDTPLKYYSSGMYMRLGFSIAFHLAPEVLLVDEVLAVGDVAFQEKCLAKMKEMAAEGRTVVFVSHNLALVKALCQTSLVLNDGVIDFRGSAMDGVARYVQSFAAAERPDNSQGRGVRWRHIALNGQSGIELISADAGEPFEIAALLECHNEHVRGRFVCQILSASREMVLSHTIDQQDLGIASLDSGCYRVHIALPPLWLSPGIYTLLLKFIGDSSQALRTRESTSEPVLISIPGDSCADESATLSPRAHWAVTRNTAPDTWSAEDCAGMISSAAR